jgi:hypothetical protein
MDLLKQLFYIYMYVLHEDGVPKLLKPSAEDSPTFWNMISMKSFEVVHKWTARIIFQQVMAIRGSCGIFKKDLVKNILFARYYAFLSSAIVKCTQNKHTYM